MGRTGGPLTSRTDSANSIAAAGAVVLGVGRSGTSAVTRTLVASGFYAGASSELLEANSANPAGYWENLAVFRANEEILARIGASWFMPPTLEAQVKAQPWAQPMLRTVLSRLLDEAGTAPLAVKDPRIGVLLEVWGPLIDAALHPVLVVRNPVEIALSLAVRDGTPTAFALASWELHIARLLEYLNGRTVTVVPYARLLASSEAVRSFLDSVVGRLASERTRHVQPSAALGAIEPQLYRNRVVLGELGDYLTGRQQQLWRFLDDLSLGNQVLDVPSELTRPNEIARVLTECEDNRVRQQHCVDELRAQVASQRAQLASQRSEIVELARRAHVAEQARADSELARARADGSLMAVKRSNSWRLTGPLRTVGGLLRRV